MDCIRKNYQLYSEFTTVFDCFICSFFDSIEMKIDMVDTTPPSPNSSLINKIPFIFVRSLFRRYKCLSLSVFENFYQVK